MRVLLTGSTGYIGRRLKQRLLQDRSIQLRLFVRNKNALSKESRQVSEVVEGDTFDKESLKRALSGVDTAYYLIHSLSNKEYKNLDRISAQNFVDTAYECGVKRIIYLGGLGVKDENTSEHLLSRIETGEVLSSNKHIQTLWFRAGVIIGSGSASFEIIRNLTEKLPIMTTPKWVDTMAQPIAVEDVLNYLEVALHLEYEKSLVVDIGAEQLSYKQMMQKTAHALELNRVLIPLPFMSINLSSYWLNLFTPVPFSVAKALIEGLKSEVIIQNDNASKYFSQIKPINYENAVLQAIEEMKSNQIISRWNDNAGRVWEKDHDQDIADAIFVDRKVKSFDRLNRHQVYESFCSIGGKNGWFGYDFLWAIRGMIDKLIGGVGIKRGRRDEKTLRIGDSLDFWKVVDLKEDDRLLLYAQMKLPGDAWLEFKIKDDQLIQSAYFYPKGLFGRLYWYSLVPLHYLIFSNMINAIIKRANEIDS